MPQMPQNRFSILAAPFRFVMGYEEVPHEADERAASNALADEIEQDLPMERTQMSGVAPSIHEASLAVHKDVQDFPLPHPNALWLQRPRSTPSATIRTHTLQPYLPNQADRCMRARRLASDTRASPLLF